MKLPTNLFSTIRVVGKKEKLKREEAFPRVYYREMFLWG